MEKMFPASGGISRREKKERKERARPASNRDAFYHVAADQICAWNLTRFPNRFCLMRNARTLYRLHAVNFWAHGCYRANRFCKLCRTWLKCYWLPGNASACVIENTSEAGRGLFLSYNLFSCCERPVCWQGSTHMEIKSTWLHNEDTLILCWFQSTLI